MAVVYVVVPTNGYECEYPILAFTDKAEAEAWADSRDQKLSPHDWHMVHEVPVHPAEPLD
jgi:hypothetical protein